MPQKRVAQLEVNAAKQIVRNSKYTDQRYRSDATGPSLPREFPSIVMVLTTTQLQRMAGATPGKGSGKIQTLQNGSYADLNTTVYPMLNPTTTLISSGAYCLCCLAYGTLHVLTVDACSKVTQ